MFPALLSGRDAVIGETRSDPHRGAGEGDDSKRDR
jgi:hypothetical protein